MGNNMLRSICFTASYKGRKRILKEKGRFFDTDLPVSDWSLHYSETRLSMLRKNQIAMLQQALDRIDTSATVEIKELWAEKGKPYGTAFWMDDEVDTAGGNYYRTSRIALKVNGFRLPAGSKDRWSTVLRMLKPLHIVF